MNKIANSLMGLLIIFTSFAHAGPMADQAQQIADRLRAVESDLSRRDASDLYRALDNAKYILDTYPQIRAEKYACLSNGMGPAFQKFFLTSLTTNTRLGGGTSLGRCQAVLAAQKDGLICLSNGQSSAFEKFTLFNIRTNSAIGDYTSYDMCLASIPR